MKMQQEVSMSKAQSDPHETLHLLGALHFPATLTLSNTSLWLINSQSMGSPQTSMKQERQSHLCEHLSCSLCYIGNEIEQSFMQALISRKQAVPVSSFGENSLITDLSGLQALATTALAEEVLLSWVYPTTHRVTTLLRKCKYKGCLTLKGVCAMEGWRFLLKKGKWPNGFLDWPLTVGSGSAVEGGLRKKNDKKVFSFELPLFSECPPEATSGYKVSTYFFGKFIFDSWTAARKRIFW